MSSVLPTWLLVLAGSAVLAIMAIVVIVAVVISTTKRK